VTAFQPFLPRYYGTCRKRVKDGLAEFLMIENLTTGI
jgi:hypothetical protein